MAIFPKRIDLRRVPVTTVLDFTGTSILKISFGAANAAFATITGGSEGEPLMLFLQQDSVGSRTATWPANVVWVGGSAPTLATGAHDVNLIEFRKIGASYIATSIGAAAFAAEL